MVLVGAVVVWAAVSGGDGPARGSRTSVAIAQLPEGPAARQLLPLLEEKAPAQSGTVAIEPLPAAPAQEPETPASQPALGAEKAAAEAQETAGVAGAEESQSAALEPPAPIAAPPPPPVQALEEAPLQETAQPREREEIVTAALPQGRAATPPPPGSGLAPAPDPGLIIDGRNGPLPVIGPDGRRAWQVYARPFDGPQSRPRIAILLAGLGLSQAATKAAIQQLPGTVTLGFAPYARGLADWMNEARAAGHEVFLELPMEPFDYPESDPGPHTLLTSLQQGDNLERLDWLLSRTSGYVGVTNFMGDKFTSAPESLGPILEALRDRGLMFLDARTSRDSIAGELATRIDLPRALNNRFLDNEASRIAIDGKLLELEDIAKTVGYAVGIGFPYPVTLERIARWSATLEDKGIVLAPISAVANLQTE